MWALQEAAVRASVLETVIVWQSPYDYSEELDFSYPVDEGKLAEGARARLDEVIGGAVGGHDRLEIEPIVVEGDPAEALCRRAAEADVLVVGSRGHGTFARLLLGSVSSKCAHHSPIPVVIVPAPRRGGTAPFGPAGRIVVGVDGSEGSLRALRWAVGEAGTRGAIIEAVIVWRGIEVDDDMAPELATFPSLVRHERAGAEHAKGRLAQLVSDVVGESGVLVEPIVLEGDPAEVLCQRAAQADLLVAGARGRGAFVELSLGSVSAKCAHHSPRPVAIVPGDRDVPASVPQARG